MVKDINKTTYISTATTTNIATNNVVISTINVPIALTGTATFQDRAGSPVAYFVLPIGAIGDFTMESNFPNGLAVVTSAADKLMVNWRQ